MRRTTGLTMVELVVALSILVLISMGLMSMIVSAQRLTNLTREKATALNAIRAYTEAMRGKSLPALLGDTSTPVDFLPAAGVGAGLKNAQGEVLKLDYENGGTCARSATGSNVTTHVAFAASEASALGFTTGGFDLDGDGTFTSNPAAPNALVVLPVRIQLSWTSFTPSGAGGNATQSLVEHVYFSNP